MRSKWKRISALLLAVGMMITLAVSGIVPGAFAEEDTTPTESAVQPEESVDAKETGSIEEETVSTDEETGSTEEKSTDVSSDAEEKTTENIDSPETYAADSASSNTIVFDLAKGSVSLTDDSYSGYDSAGQKITGIHSENNQYRIEQSNSQTATSNTIRVGTTSTAVTKKFAVYLAGINICVTTASGCPVYINSGASGKVYLILANETKNIAEISYKDGNKQNYHAAIEKEVNTSGLLCITCEDGYAANLRSSTGGHNCSENGVCGKLLAYANLTHDGESNGPYNAGAGIGSRGGMKGGSVNSSTGEIAITTWLDNITIAGGIITSYGAAGDSGASGGGAGIGTGSCINSYDTGAGIHNFRITGGYINAIAGDDSASCIGGGYRSNEVHIDIYNGTIVATDRVATVKRVRGTGIGAGGGGSQSGSPSVAEVNIYGGNITASSQYGAAIGGAGSGDGTGSYTDEQVKSQPAYVYIYGGTINAMSSGNGAAIGTGGPIGKNTAGKAGDATVVIENGVITASSESGADIGGGGVASNDSQSRGGDGSVTILGGSVISQNGGIGGGVAIAGKGGNAQITISGGDVTTPSIGGGNSNSNNGGNAYVSVTKGTLTVSGTIGGGNSESGNGGDASIYVSGGTLNCASIGGGNSVSGKPGSVTSETQKAGVIVTGGTLNTGTIGGGTNENGDIGFATADISGGQIQGRFILSNTDTTQKCFFHMTGGTIDNTALSRNGNETAQKFGGAVYLSDPNGEVTISGGTIQNAGAEKGGAVYMTAGTFTLSGTGTLQNCNATQTGGAVYLENGSVEMTGGCILSCNAKQGGGIYLSSGTVTLTNGTIGIADSPNTAEEGAGVYIAGGNLKVNGGSVQYNTAKTGAGAYLKSGSMTMSTGQLLHNVASENGGGAYLAGGTLTVSGGIIQENSAALNGGGAYLADGSFQLSGGRISQNTAVDGAGAYLKKGNLTVSGGGDFDNNTASHNGGGAYLAGGALMIDSGAFNSNTATNDGGGAYLAGGTLTIDGGSFGNNIATNGGGAYAADGKVRMFGGFVTGNRAEKDGGGLYVSSAITAADVVIRSGSITNNTSGGNGGAIAVVSDKRNAADKVILGLLETHPDLANDRSFSAFDYTDTVDNSSHNHSSCPVLSGNAATGNGGAIYMDSSAATLDIYCLTEKENHSQANINGSSIMSVGGTVSIGDQENNSNNARGNIVIGSAMLVEGGTVDIWGNMQNPLFENNILVDIQANAGAFGDHRKQSGSVVSYKVHYFENFTNGGTQTATGFYTAIQYAINENVPALGSLFSHTGWKIIGWDTKADGSGTRYNIGTQIGNQTDHSAWQNADDPLILYAIWQRTGYTVVFQPNAPAGTAYSGSMANQKFDYNVAQQLTANAFQITGKRFTGWKDGNGIAYAADYKASRMTTEDGATIMLYAQWVDCTHLTGEHPGHVIYRVSGTTIAENCDCGYTAAVTLSAVSGYYDQKPHPAKLGYVGTLLEETPTIHYQYRANETSSYGELQNGETVPTGVGYYKASITIGGNTVSVEYEITSPTAGTSLNAKIVAGQFFADFKGGATATIPQDDAFTVQFDVLNLNTEVYQTAPTLSFGAALPDGTTIIMQTVGSYWYIKSPTGAEITLTEFTKMGGTEKFQYTAGQMQSYRFIVDFSQASETDETRMFLLTYAPTGASGLLTASAALTTVEKRGFDVSASDGGLTVQAPASDSSNRWYEKELMLVLTAPNDVPADATLTVAVGDKTTVSALNARRQFVVPLTWGERQDVALRLNSALALQAGKQYALTAELYTGVSGGKLSATGKTAFVKLTIPVSTLPSLQLSGTSRVVSIDAKELPLNVKMQNTDGCTVSAIIQRKNGSDYGGNFLTVDSLQAGNQQLSLAAITAPGSYRVYVTISKDGRTLLNVPYYFIVE